MGIRCGTTYVYRLKVIKQVDSFVNTGNSV